MPVYPDCQSGSRWFESTPRPSVKYRMPNGIRDFRFPVGSTHGTTRRTPEARGGLCHSWTPKLARCIGFGANLPGELGLRRSHNVAFWVAASFYPVTPETPPQGLTTRVGVAEANTMKHTSVRCTATVAVIVVVRQ